MRAIVGDNSDNIKGVYGIGEVSVPRMFPFLSQRESGIDELIEHSKKEIEINKDFDKNSKKKYKDLKLEMYGFKTKAIVQYKKLLEQEDIFRRNVELMKLTLPKEKKVSSVILEELNKKIEVNSFDFKSKWLRDKLPSDECSKYWSLFQRVIDRSRETDVRA